MIEIIDPIGTPGWDSLLLRTEGPDFFHSSAWAKVLKESYRYKPLYFASIENGRLNLSLPLMEVDSPWTGKRGVSLPFSDHCVPYFLNKQILQEAIGAVIEYGRRAGWRYVEARAAEYFEDHVPSWGDYYQHEISLSGGDELSTFARLMPGNRRNIKKAGRAGLSIEINSSWDALASFCRLNTLTRKRHGLPPQPPIFFNKAFEHILSRGQGLVISASHGPEVIASSVFFHFGKRALYKYGASAPGYLHLRPNNLVMWEAIKWYRNHGYETLSLGRTEMDNPGLLRYKRSWRAEERPLRYFRYGYKDRTYVAKRPGGTSYQKALSRFPSWLLQTIGRLMYRHVG